MNKSTVFHAVLHYYKSTMNTSSELIRKQANCKLRHVITRTCGATPMGKEQFLVQLQCEETCLIFRQDISYSV